MSQDFDTPEVTGSVTMKPADVAALQAQIQAITGLGAAAIANATDDPPELEFRAIIVDSDGNTTKTLQIDDAKFAVPALSGSV